LPGVPHPAAEEWGSRLSEVWGFAAIESIGRCEAWMKGVRRPMREAARDVRQGLKTAVAGATAGA
jgi:hypothetical protein